MDENSTTEHVKRRRINADMLRITDTDTNDLVAMMRTCNPWDDAPSKIAETLANAADAIERLTREGDELQELVACMGRGDWELENAALRARIAQLEDELEDERFSRRVERYLKGGERYD